MGKRTYWRLFLLVALLAFGGSAGAQTPAGGTAPVAPAKITSGTLGDTAPVPAASPAAQTGTPAVKPTALALQTEKLLAMATELKLRVDKTNKDILSCAVMRQAEEIEQYAHQLKQGGAKK
jgi:hypothetical protein